MVKRRRKKKIKMSEQEFDKTEFVEKELVDKLTLWMLRIIIKLYGNKEFLDENNSFLRDEVAYFLDLGKFVDMDAKDFQRREPLAILKKNLLKFEKRKRFTSSKILTANIKKISKLMHLNGYEEQILEYFILLDQYAILQMTTNFLGNSLNTMRAKKILSVILDIPISGINNAFKSDSKFSKSSLITIFKNDTQSISSKFQITSSEFADNMLNLDEDISEMIKDSVRPCNKSDLSIKDYEHIQKDIDILLPYLKTAYETKTSGVNILLYGLPGTGKTELAKVISKALDINLYEISYADTSDEVISSKERLMAYKTAQTFFAYKNTMLMYDEAEDIFDSSDSLFMSKKQKDKAWINRILENNTVPTIWITNNIYSIDNAMIRRFDVSIEMPIPKRSKRVQIIKKYTNNFLDEQSIKIISENKNIAPALITRAAKVMSAIQTNESSKVFIQVLNNTLKAQGYKEIKESLTNPLSNLYDSRFINTTMDLEVLAQGIKKHQNARLCLYGVAGTGKSTFGRYIAQSLDKPALLKKGSDLISKWVGGTEENIANAFEEAKEEKAILIFDEVDSFLANRTQAVRNWEVTQVNEMLVQMENFEGIFIATTNLMNNLDRASLRRFDLKLEFDYLKKEQAWNMFVLYCKELNLSKPSFSCRKSVENLRYLTPGDFAAVVRQNRFRPMVSLRDFVERLEDEVRVKGVEDVNVAGFR